MSEISERILNLIEKNNLSYGELSRITKIPKSALQRYATGQTTNIPLNRIESIADALHVSSKHILGWDDKKDHASNEIPISGVVPILGVIPADVPIFSEENIEGYMPVTVHHPEEYFCLRVHGTSMINAGIPDGATVLVHQQDCADNGQIVACRVNGDEATLKRFKQVKGTVVLLPENPSFQPILVKCADFESGGAYNTTA